MVLKAKYHLSVLTVFHRERHFKDISALFRGLLNGIWDIHVERKSSNETLHRRLPPVMLFELIQLRPTEFYGIVQSQLQRLLHSKTLGEIDILEQKFLAYTRAY